MVEGTMSKRKNVFAVSFLAIALISSAHAEIVSAGKLGAGSSGYDIDAKSLSVQGTPVLTSHQNISGKMDKTVSADKNGIIVRDKDGLAMKGTGTDITVSDAGAITVAHATSADSATSATTAGTANAVAWGNVSGKPSTFAPSAHNQASNTINAMTGYEKASTAAAISAEDSLNTAIGKLEKALDGKQASLSGTEGNIVTYGASSGAVSSLAVQQASNPGADATENATVPTVAYVGELVNEAVGNYVATEQSDANSVLVTDNGGQVVTLKITDTYVDSSAAISTGKLAIPTGWSKGSSTAALGAGDSVSSALGKLENRVVNAQNKIPSGSENSSTLASIWVE